MNSSLLGMMVPGVLIAMFGCSSAPTQEPTQVTEAAEQVTGCPTPGSGEAAMRSAASLAFNLMRLAAATGGPVPPVYANTILASQRYKVRSSGTGIEFRTTDRLYRYVTPEMIGILELEQQDPEVAKFLSDGQLQAYKTNGWWFPSVNAISALANFTSPGPTTTHIPDYLSANDSHNATVTSTAWCDGDKILIKETVQKSNAFSPLEKRQITNAAGCGNNTPIGDWLNASPREYNSGGAQVPSTPFNGPSANPYLVISLTTKGVTTSWATYDWTPDVCWSHWPTWQCTGYLEIDPVPYTEPAAYYNANGMVGTQANPFTVTGTLWAHAGHQGQWAKRTVLGVQELGMFINPRRSSLTGITQYGYVKY